jgi:hypothetical protein
MHGRQDRPNLVIKTFKNYDSQPVGRGSVAAATVLNPLNIDRTELLGFSGLEQSLTGGNNEW